MGDRMTERQKLIEYKQAIQSAKIKLKQMDGIDVLEIFGPNEPDWLNELFRAYSTTYGCDVKPCSKLPCSSSAEAVYSWTIDTMGLRENKEYFFFCGVWSRIKLLDLRLAVPSLWRHGENTRGFLLADAELSRFLEAGADSRDEYNYLIDIWNCEKSVT